MANNSDRTRSVTIKWISDQGSLRQMLNDLDLVEARLIKLGLISSGGPPGSRSGPTGAIPPPTTPLAGNGPFGGHGMAGVGGLIQSMMVTVQDMTVNATNVTINSQNISGGGAPSGSGGPPSSGGHGGSPHSTGVSPHATGAQHAQHHQTFMQKAFEIPQIGPLLEEFMPFAPYMATAYLTTKVLESSLEQRQADREKISLAKTQELRGLVGDNGGLGGYQSYVNEMDRKTWAGADFLTRLIPLVGPEIVKTREWHREEKLIEAQIEESRQGIAKRASYGVNQWGVEKWLANAELMVPEAEYAEYREFGGGRGRVQTNKALVERGQFRRRESIAQLRGFQNVLGGREGFIDDPEFQSWRLRYVEGSEQQAIAQEEVERLMSMLPSTDPRLQRAAGGRRFGSLTGMTKRAARRMALTGDVSGLFANRLIFNDPKVGGSAGLVDSELETAYMVLEQNEEIGVEGYLGSTVRGYNSASESRLQREMLNGRVATRSMRDDQVWRANINAQSKKRAMEIYAKQYQNSLTSGDPLLTAKAQADFANAQAEYEMALNEGNRISRTTANDIYGERQASVGYGSATVARRIAEEQRSGTPGSIYSAKQGEVGIVDKRIEAEQERYDLLKKGNMTEAQRIEAETRIYTLQTERAELLKRNNLELAQGELGITQSRMGSINIGASISDTIYGSNAGGREAQAGARAATIAKLRAVQAQQNAEQAAATQVQIDSLEAEETMSPYKSMTYSPETRSRARNVDFYNKVMSMTWAGQGNVRGGLRASMEVGNQMLAERTARYQADLAKATTPEAKIAAEESYERDKMEIMTSRVLPAQQALEHGWQERLISQVFGANQGFSGVMHGFTNREASQFYGIYNRYFGGTKEQMERARGEAALAYSAITGGQSSEGLTNQAASMSGLAPLTGSLDINITLKDPAGNLIDKSRSQAIITNAQGQTVPNPGQGTFISG